MDVFFSDAVMMYWKTACGAVQKYLNSEQWRKLSGRANISLK